MLCWGLLGLRFWFCFCVYCGCLGGLAYLVGLALGLMVDFDEYLGLICFELF